MTGRCSALTMPSVTVLDAASGEPIAITVSPTGSSSELPNWRTVGFVDLDLDHREVGLRVAADERASRAVPSVNTTVISGPR